MTFLLVSLAVSIANLRLRAMTHSKTWLVLLGIALMLITTGLLVAHLATHKLTTLLWLGAFFAAIVIVETLFCQRECPLVPDPSNNQAPTEEHKSE